VAQPVIEVTIDRSDRTSGQFLAYREIPIPPEYGDGFFPAHVVALENGNIVVGDSENSVVYLVAEGRFEPVTSYGVGPGEIERVSNVQRVPGGFAVVSAVPSNPRVVRYDRDGSFVEEIRATEPYPMLGLAGDRLVVRHTASSDVLLTVFDGDSDQGAILSEVGQMLHQKYEIPEEHRDMATPVLTALTDDVLYVSHGMISYVDAFSLDGSLLWSVHIDDRMFRQMDFVRQFPRGAALINADIDVDDRGRVFLAKAVLLGVDGHASGLKAGVIDLLDPENQRYALLLVEGVSVSAVSCWNDLLVIGGFDLSYHPYLLVVDHLGPIDWIRDDGTPAGGSR
jgi:hypothetical protein